VVVLSGSCAALEATPCHCRANADGAGGTRIGALEPDISGLQRPGSRLRATCLSEIATTRRGAALRYRTPMPRGAAPAAIVPRRVSD